MARSNFILFRDACGAWCAAPPQFRNIVRDPIGRGETRAEAVRELMAHPEFVHRALCGEWPLYPSLTAFVEVAPAARFFTRGGPARGVGRCATPCRQQTLRLVWSRDDQVSHAA